MRTCRTCKKKFKPSSRHKDCPVCRAIQQKTPCIDCGKLSNGKYKRCIMCHNKAHAGSNNGNWKGGKSYHKKGYRMLRIVSHPRASAGYVFEHIVVMEKKLGRYLAPGENVHHKNGVKDDNRIKNLELWTRSQPAGIRAKDAVRWAQEVLERYAPELLK